MDLMDLHQHFSLSDMFVFHSLLERLKDLDVQNDEILHIKELKTRLKKVFGKEISIDTDQVKDLDRYLYSISGLYIEEDLRIILIISASKNSKGMVMLHDIDEFRFEVAQIIQHEFVHHMQHLKRDKMVLDNYTMCPDKDGHEAYLAEYDEIDAYSYDVAMEFDKYGWWNSRMLNLYKKTFGSQHPVMKRLLKKTYKHMEKLYD